MMNPLFKLDFWQRKPLVALLGLALDGNRLEGVVLRRQDGYLRPTQSFTAILALDLLTDDPELVGREILNHLEAAGIRERSCAVAVPLKWALTAHTTIPVLTEADTQTFLQLEAERGFPCDVTTLRVATSRYTAPSGEKRATFVGLPVAHLERLEQVLRAAKLKPLTFSSNSTALQLPSGEASNGVLALVLGENQVVLQITCGGGIAALRALDGMMETEVGERVVNADLLLRETRITLGQLTSECRATVKHIRVFGPSGLACALVRDVGPRFESMGMSVDAVTHYTANEFGAPIPLGTAISVAFSLAARYMMGCADSFEFLLPKIPTWRRLAARYLSGRLQTVGGVAAALFLLVSGAFGVQQLQLFWLDSQWAKMEKTVGELKAIQQQIQQYRPWFDDSLRCLTVLREMTMAFPEDGAVTVKTLEIRNQNTVSCSGTAHDHAALLQTLNQLRAVAGVHNLKVEQIRGKTPLQFTFGFQYGSEETREN